MTNEPLDLHDLIPDGAFDPYAEARNILARVLGRRDTTELLTPVVAHWVDNVLRARTRAVEEATFSRAFPARGGKGRTWKPAVNKRAAFLSARFALGDGTLVTWGEATVEQHQLRVEMLERQQAGIGATIARHRFAVEVLEAAGVDRLLDLPDLPEELAA